MTTKPKQVNREAFTLIEMMVVVAVIGVLIAGVFRLMGAAGENNNKAKTIARLQRLQNALSGFYAEYGTYPPVTQGDYASPDPYQSRQSDGTYQASGTLTSKNANSAAGAQPVAFSYPNVESLNEFINLLGQQQPAGQQFINANEAIGGQAATIPESDPKKVLIFRFGVLSYLLPRVELMGGVGTDTPNKNFYDSKQWKKNNSGSREAQRDRENRAVGRWLPNFEGCLTGGWNILGIDTAAPDEGGPRLASATQYPMGSGSSYALLNITIRDGWARDCRESTHVHELFYYSEPPYQSYRVWSSGLNGVTFPPWISLQSLPSEDQKKVTAWVEDDIVRFDR